MTVTVTWRDFESEAPDIAAVAAMVWPGITALNRGEPGPPGAPWFPIAFLATARRDGSPRLHPVLPGPGGRAVVRRDPAVLPQRR